MLRSYSPYINGVVLISTLMTLLGCFDKTASPKTLESSEISTPPINIVHVFDYDTTKWKEITSNDQIILDIRYATDSNFTKKVIYSCPRCFLRPQLAEKIISFNNQLLRSSGHRLKIFDCYRPRPAQQRLWDVVPNPIYVTPPWKGSMHNRGLAVDLTIVDSTGIELDMGTDFDFFGPEAHTDHLHLNNDVNLNRLMLKEGLQAFGLFGIQSEWWHYSLRDQKSPISEWEWSCD